MIATIQKLSMLQYNAHKFKNQIMIFCFRNQTIKNFHIIAIQKSSFNFYFDTIHHSLKNNYHFVFSNFQKMKKKTKSEYACSWLKIYHSAIWISFTASKIWSRSKSNYIKSKTSFIIFNCTIFTMSLISYFAWF